MKKRMLATSFLSIIMCLSLIVGAAMAFFGTESKVNIAVTSGRVDVVAEVDTESVDTKQYGEEYQAGKDHTFGADINFDGGMISLSKFVPGDGVRFNVNIFNNSNIDIQYRVSVSCFGGEELFGQLQIEYDMARQLWTPVQAGSEIEPIAVTIEFPYIDNFQEYQGLDTEFALIVEAVQGNAETQNNEITVTATGTPEENGAALVQALEAVDEGGTVYVPEGEFVIPTDTYESTINGTLSYGLLIDKSVTLKGAMAGVSASDPARGTNETVIGGSVNGYNSGAILIAKYDVDVVIDGFTFESGAWDTIGNDDPGVRNVTIVNNVFKVDESTTGGTPIKLKLAGGVISDNQFIGKNCGYGVRVNEIDSRPGSWGGVVPEITMDVTIENNDFSGFTLQNTSRGVVSINSKNPGKVTLSGNDFTGIAGKAINKENDTAGITITSDKDKGVTEENVSEGVTILNRYVTDGADLLQAIETASAGDTLYLAEGTFLVDRQIVIKQDLTLIGEGADKTVIKMTTDNLPSAVHENEYYMQVCTENGPVDFKMQGIHLSGPDELTHWMSNALVVGYSTTETNEGGSVEIDSCKFTNFTKGGVVIKGGSAVIKNSEILVTPYAQAAPNAIQIDMGAEAEIVGNVITSAETEQSEERSIGLYILRGGNAKVVSDNRFVDCEIAICVNHTYEPNAADSALAADAQDVNTFENCTDIYVEE